MAEDNQARKEDFEVLYDSPLPISGEKLANLLLSKPVSAVKVFQHKDGDPYVTFVAFHVPTCTVVVGGTP